MFAVAVEEEAYAALEAQAEKDEAAIQVDALRLARPWQTGGVLPPAATSIQYGRSASRTAQRQSIQQPAHQQPRMSHGHQRHGGVQPAAAQQRSPAGVTGSGLLACAVRLGAVHAAPTYSAAV